MKQKNIKKAPLTASNTAAAVGTAKANADTGKENKRNFQLAFGPVNYILMAVGILVLALGYILLSGGGSDDPNTFNPEMFDSRRLTLAPILIVLGFAVEIFAIMFKNKKQE